MKQLVDKTVDVKQLFVDEDHGLLVLRADKGLPVCCFASQTIFLSVLTSLFSCCLYSP